MLSMRVLLCTQSCCHHHHLSPQLGGYAKQKTKLIDTKKHHLLMSGHPSPLSANKGHWFGNKHFSKTNFLLEQAGQIPIDW